MPSPLCYLSLWLLLFEHLLNKTNAWVLTVRFGREEALAASGTPVSGGTCSASSSLALEFICGPGLCSLVSLARVRCSVLLSSTVGAGKTLYSVWGWKQMGGLEGEGLHNELTLLSKPHTFLIQSLRCLSFNWGLGGLQSMEIQAQKAFPEERTFQAAPKL